MHFIPHEFDLNLLIVFDALYRNKTVSKSADAIHISPSAFSHALNRLRVLLDDPLFVRMGGEMQPTKRADDIAPFISEMLINLSSQVFEKKKFDPLTSSQSFTISATDYTAFCVIPSLIKKLKSSAPNIKLKIIFQNMALSFEDLKLGKIDLILGYSEQLDSSSGVNITTCFTDKYIVVAPKNKYAAMSLHHYANANHIKISAWDDHDGIIDNLLKSRNIHRKISLEVPNMMIVPYLIESNDCIITLPLRAISILNSSEFDIFDLPFPEIKYTVNVYATKEDPQQWLKHQIISLFE
ncbi:LysR family transcriptional regulator [Acinetobacter pollinis]|uniref:LysR family transcriptional regulator n=1 Tax=Acinetobacter pollinis TaxID=2605270 RepID=UPI0018A2958D|nr:LysR family transcriptional regulator [Acinetobacter pollinis]MBF7691506.1 LysR family transcriptional regulator [Acinetobacter pollinis]MBF7693702.1 LysR family transcriptional regulator [Acinetobacter pollinis]MBF7699217.1 LysR family transcriptional regulator [Acinetobacter pollinis]MBF7701221.1 LysR family transcriptional regulator [Acinetobacter pollinis]